MKSYDQFLEDLAGKESSGNYQAINKKTKYLGKYQMGKAALIDAKYYKQDGKEGNTFSNAFWIGKDGVKSEKDFLNNPQAQENAIRNYMEIQWKYILDRGLDRHVGEAIKGIILTVSGLLAGAHLRGVKKLARLINHGIISYDKNGVPNTEYIKKFAGYETPFKPRKKLTGLQKNKKGVAKMYLIDGNSWVSKETAIQMVKNLELDGIIVTNKNGVTFLKTPPDKSISNNLAA